jgi:integrase
MRRANGDGSVYQRGRVWWIAYDGPDGKRVMESSGSLNEGDAVRLLRKRVGAREHHLPVIPRAEHLTFPEAARAVLDDFITNGKKSLVVVERRITKHLTPYFGNRRMAGITAADVRAYVTHRQRQGIVNRGGQRRADVSNAEINRELQILKRMFNLAMKDGLLGTRPHIAMLKEGAARQGFFEREQFESVRRHLPEELQPVVTFAYITGWRVGSEVLPLEWRRVDMAAGIVRLEDGTTKNGEGRIFFLTAELKAMLEEQDRRRRATGHIIPWVFFRMVAQGRGGEKKPEPITTFTKAWQAACIAAGCPGRIPHDFRRTAVRNLDRAGIPRSVAMRMVGHKTEAIYRRYRIVDEQDLKDAAARLDMVSVAAKREA